MSEVDKAIELAHDELKECERTCIDVDRQCIVKVCILARTLIALKEENNKLVQVIGEHVAKRAEYFDRAEKAEAERDKIKQDMHLVVSDAGKGLIAERDHLLMLVDSSNKLVDQLFEVIRIAEDFEREMSKEGSSDKDDDLFAALKAWKGERG